MTQPKIGRGDIAAFIKASRAHLEKQYPGGYITWKQCSKENKKRIREECVEGIRALIRRGWLPPARKRGGE